MFLSVSFSLCFHLPLHVSFAHLLLRQSQEMVDGTVQIFVSTIPKTGQKPWKEQGKNSKENCKKCNRLHSKNSCDQNIQMVGGLYTVHVSAWQLGPHLPGNWRSKGGPDRIICACWQKLSKSSPMAQAKAVCIRICRVYWWPCWCYSWSFLAHSKRYLSLHYSSIFFMTWFLHAVNLSLLACNESVNHNFVLHRGIGKIQLCLAAYKLVLVKPKRFSVNFACASSASPVQLDSLYIYIYCMDTTPHRRVALASIYFLHCKHSLHLSRAPKALSTQKTINCTVQSATSINIHFFIGWKSFAA